MPKKSTSWGRELVWGEYQKELILPNILRLLEIKNDETILDLGCGSGLFAKEFAAKGARVIGVDISAWLIDLAKQSSIKNMEFFVAPAHQLNFIKDSSVDKIVVILAIQNIENVSEVFQECHRVLKNNGRLLMVMSHPAFRVPKESSWGWDEANKIQYRRIDNYLLESKVKIEMHPSMDSEQTASSHTWTFHRPLQFYFKTLNNNGFSVARLEEWNSHKQSESGPRSAAEDKARKAIPMFLFIEANKN
ncbi:MAG: class I SAM-dependent methyltransferase [bacterium]|nr:class I SAM-dependent methyltransferase [bacterium]